MKLGELQAKLNQALAEGASKTNEVYLNIHDCRPDPNAVVASGVAYEVDQHITCRKKRWVVVRGW